jgi:hypothetical protein
MEEQKSFTDEQKNKLLADLQDADDELALIEFERTRGMRMSLYRKLQNLRQREAAAKESKEQIVALLKQAEGSDGQ